MSDSLFLLLTVACVYLARRKLYAAACVVGFFASFTRIPGVLLLALRAIERADVLLLPHGAKIADILHLK